MSLVSLIRWTYVHIVLKAALNQDFVMDSSNCDPVFLRNRVRHRLIPFLEREFNPDIKSGLDRVSSIIALEDDFMEGQAQTAFKAVLIQDTPGLIIVSAPGLADLHPALAARVLRKGLFRVKRDLRRITHTHIRDILDLAGHLENNDKSLDLPGKIRIYKKQNSLCIQRERLPLRELGRQQKADRLKSRANQGRKT